MSEIHHVLYNKPIGGEAVSDEEYINLFREKFKITNGNGNFIWEVDNIKFPWDIEIAKVST